jgi:hypothetical protein
VLRRVRQWQALSTAERRQLALLAVSLPAVELSLRRFGARRTSAWLQRWLAPHVARAPSSADLEAADALARLASIAGRHGPVAARCLSQALLVQALLRHRGLDACVRVGVRKQEGQLDAHAWVELGGRALAHAEPSHAPFREALWSELPRG